MNHVPVMLGRINALLAPALELPGAVYVDATLGLGGHAAAMLAASTHARLVGIDRDSDALAIAKDRLQEYADRCTFVHAVFNEFADVLDDLGIDTVDAVLLDLGLSSMQIDRRERGFAYSADAPLDMRMDATSKLTGANVVNDYSEAELATVIRRYGEERFAARIAARIVSARAQAPIRTSAELVALIESAIPAAVRANRGHPAKRTFQALRIEVNEELAVLEQVLPQVIERLRVGGRAAVLSYHSLEDRLVKRAFSAGAADTAPLRLAVVPEAYQPRLRLLTKGAERPAEEEVKENSRAAAARLRAAEKIREVA